MKIAKWVSLALLGFFFWPVLSAQTIDEGQGLFINDEGAIVLAADASVAIRKLDGPYILFVLYMGAKGDENITVNRDSVVMVYKGQEYKMPALREFRKNYKGEINDVELYRRLGKESLAFSQMRFWNYQGTGPSYARTGDSFALAGDFFPLYNETAVDSGSMANNQGFRTRAYFKNPGFQSGDEILIKVRDKKKPDLFGAVTVLLK